MHHQSIISISHHILQLSPSGGEAFAPPPSSERSKNTLLALIKHDESGDGKGIR